MHVCPRWRSGVLQLNEAEEALKFLIKPSTGDGPPKPVLAYPPEAYTASGELALPFSWFASMYRAME